MMEFKVDDTEIAETISGIDNLIKSIVDARQEAIRNGIKANSILINTNMVKVIEQFGSWPTMICGLNCHVTADELPDGYSFAVVEKPEDPKTNADRIRAMSDEDLASWALYAAQTIGMRYSHSLLGLVDWLKQPAEE